MEFFRQRTERFREELPRFNADRRFTGMGNEYRTADADDITEIEELKQVVRFFSKDVFTEIELNFTAQITKDAESRLTVAANGHQTAGRH